jgi:creatinine amidohydrolase
LNSGAARQRWPDQQIVAFTDLNRLLDVAFEASAKFGITPGQSGIHAGEFETSILLSTHPNLVNMARAEAGYTGEFKPIIPDLLAHGIARVSANGILGDPRASDGSRGSHYLSVWVDLIMAEIGKSRAAA